MRVALWLFFVAFLLRCSAGLVGGWGGWLVVRFGRLEGGEKKQEKRQDKQGW